MVDQAVTPSFFRPGTLHKDDGMTQSIPFEDGKEQWVLIDSTPATCVQIGLFHYFKDRGPIDLVLSGPNYGRNTTAVFALSSGTIGGAMEGCVCGYRSIALSYAFDSREHDHDLIAAASRVSTKLVEKLMKEWPADVHLYSINVPLRKGVETTKIIYTEMLQNKWTTGSSFKKISAEEEAAMDSDSNERDIRHNQAQNSVDRTPAAASDVRYKWAPNFGDIRKFSEGAGGDGWTIVNGMISVTPLRANFWHLPNYKGEIKL